MDRARVAKTRSLSVSSDVVLPTRLVTSAVLRNQHAERGNTKRCPTEHMVAASSRNDHDDHVSTFWGVGAKNVGSDTSVEIGVTRLRCFVTIRASRLLAYPGSSIEEAEADEREQQAAAPHPEPHRYRTGLREETPDGDEQVPGERDDKR